MSRDWTPREHLAVERRNIQAGYGSLFDFMRRTAVRYNGDNFPFHTEEDVLRREQYPLFGKLLNRFEALYASLSAIDGGLEFLERKEKELERYVETGEGCKSSLVIRWFEGNLGDSNYDLTLNEARLVRLLPIEASLSKELVDIHQLAGDIDEFARSNEPYEYADQVEDREQHVQSIEDQIQSGEISVLVDYLLVFEYDEHDELRDEAYALIARLDQAISPQPSKELMRFGYMLGSPLYEPRYFEAESWDHAVSILEQKLPVARMARRYPEEPYVELWMDRGVERKDMSFDDLQGVYNLYPQKNGKFFRPKDFPKSSLSTQIHSAAERAAGQQRTATGKSIEEGYSHE